MERRRPNLSLTWSSSVTFDLLGLGMKEGKEKMKEICTQSVKVAPSVPPEDIEQEESLLDQCMHEREKGKRCFSSSAAEALLRGNAARDFQHQ